MFLQLSHFIYGFISRNGSKGVRYERDLQKKPQILLSLMLSSRNLSRRTVFCVDKEFANDVSYNSSKQKLNVCNFCL